MSALDLASKTSSPPPPSYRGASCAENPPSANDPPLSCPATEDAKRIETAPTSPCVPRLERDILVKIASESGEWEQAFELVAANYKARGYVAPQSEGLYFTPYHALPETIVVVAKDKERVVATFTCILDNRPLGLPLAQVFPEEVGKLREADHRLGEVTSLAQHGLSRREFMTVLRTMMKLGMQWGAHEGGDTTVIAVNPRNRNPYTRMFGFLPLGSCRPYTQARGAPAEAFWVDWEQLKTRTPHIYQEVFGTSLPPQTLAAPAMPRTLVREFDRRAICPRGCLLDDLFDYVDRFGKSCSW